MVKNIISDVCSPVGNHTDHVIFMGDHTGHQYIIPRRGRDKIRTGSKMKMILLTPVGIDSEFTVLNNSWCMLQPWGSY